MILQQYNIHAAKTNLSALVEKAAKGDSFIIAKAGKPMVKVIPITPQNLAKKRIGFLKGQIKIPDDFNTMGQNETLSQYSPAIYVN